MYDDCVYSRRECVCDLVENVCVFSTRIYEEWGVSAPQCTPRSRPHCRGPERTRTPQRGPGTGPRHGRHRW